MKDLNITSKLIAGAALVVITAASVVFHGEGGVHAQDTPPPVGERISFGMVGITQGQTVRVNAANVIAENDSDFPPGPTRVAIIVVNSRGELMRDRDGNAIRRIAMLERGESTFLNLNADDLQWPPGPIRLQLRAVVTAIPPAPPDSSQLTPSSIAPSVEVFNNANGRTVVFIDNPGVVRGFNPQPDPPLANQQPR
jgi:hypothetical protein